MTLHLHDSLTRSSREFVPQTPGQVSIYVCGATVQAAPHIGHIRSGVAFDVLVRWLRRSGFAVTLVRNVTDIDDKILAKAVIEDRPWWAVAAHYEREFTWAYDVLGCARPTIEPRATGHVPQMIELMARLIDAGHAYAVDGDVYFDVRSFAEYGALTRQQIDDMLPAGDSEHDSRKRDARDFALWKGTKPGEPSWDTPWGRGRPGWHLECSAMAAAYLGSSFDIHGGGLDLMFPHHENEIAQSRAAGDGFARYWMHNAWVTTAGEKMSKSLGNSLLVKEIVQRVRPVELRWYLISAHYRSNLEFSDESMQESAVAYQRIENFVARATERLGDAAGAVDPAEHELPEAFAAAMDDDLSVPAALAVLHEHVTEGNKLLGASGDGASAAAGDLLAHVAGVRAMLDVLGVDPLAGQWASSAGDDRWHAVVEALVSQQIQARAQARADRDFAAADAIRDGLKAAGITLEDTPQGARWSL